MLIDICVATFRRPDLLAILLESLAGQVVAADIEYRIIVIDNDESESARATIESLREKLPCRILYAVEPARGISYARNRAISLVTGDCLAFLDDDEFVTAGWLQSMVDTLGANDVDMVFGPVGHHPGGRAGLGEGQSDFLGSGGHHGHTGRSRRVGECPAESGQPG